ncbi:HD domain-containing protein [Mycoplasmoides pirum]|uniref:HD domain-containing protein n=1 Tax=Mycoplasmoides pirum TaxID=2122 RepID=UPI000698090C|nr:HD domain-containing protein [Mycoplasmoides pirum]
MNKVKYFSFKPLSKLQFLKDPIHGEINFDDDTLWMYDILNTKEFKRLQDIKQLGLSIHTFPGASHTRASHCLGAYEVMRRILTKPSFKSISKNEKLILLCAALLHDLGHGPHSHAFEDYFLTSLDEDSKYLFHHEWFSVNLITNPKGEIAPILLKNNIDPNLVASLIQHDKKKNNLLPSWMTQLISSELDVDRIDYLLRDSYYTGTNYGYIDSRALIHWINFDSNKKCVSFSKKAIPIIENFLIGRYHMYQSVYLNEKTSLLVATLWFAFKRIKDLDFHNKFDWNNNTELRDVLKIFFANESVKKIDLDKYLFLTDSMFNSFLSTTYLKSKDKILHKILESFFEKNKYIMLLFDDFKIRDFEYKKFTNLENAKYFVTKYEFPTKAFYSPNKNSSGITIFDDTSKKNVSIINDSELIKNGNKLFTQNNKYKYGILIHEDFLNNNSTIAKILKR